MNAAFYCYFDSLLEWNAQVFVLSVLIRFFKKKKKKKF